MARKLRRNATDVEHRLWRALRESRLPWRFRRQHPIGGRIADFACPARKLVIELDGGQHAERIIADQLRTEELARRGYRVIRFWNNDVIDNIEGVLETIRQELEQPPPHPNPLRPQGRRGS
jgi:very-short-patch-repair endonuclease